MANIKDPVEKALMASWSTTITSKDSINSNLATLMVDSEASGHYFDDAIIRGLKHRLRQYVHITTPRNILTAGGGRLNGTAEGVLQREVLSPMTTATKSSFGSISWRCPGLGATCSR